MNTIRQRSFRSRQFEILERRDLLATFTVTTVDDALSKEVEPLAPPSSVRFRALRILAEEGIETRIALMPTLPFLEDTWENVSGVVESGSECGVRAIIPWFGMSLRDRQRAYFYRRLDELFPGLRAKYETTYGDDYMCPSPNARELAERFAGLCSTHGIATSVRPQLAPTAEQLKLG